MWNSSISSISTQRELELIKEALDYSAIVAVTDRTGKITYANDNFCKISKYSQQELLGQNHRILNSGYHPKSFFIDLWDTISKGKMWQGEIQNRAKDGSHYWVYTSIIPFLNPLKEIEQYVSIRFEITSRKRAEEQLQKFAEQLLQSNKELETFASVAAHDLQEPLRKVLAFSDRFLQKFRSSIPVEGQDYLDRMQSATIRMQQLINDLLTYSRINSRAKPIHDTSLNEVIQDVLNLLELKIQQSSAQIQISELPTIQADPGQMVQLFQNLIGNSLKFQTHDKTPKIQICSVDRGAFVQIDVIDNGIGFEEQFNDKIFDIFQRLHGREEFDGTGIGLALCRRICERHGGSISAKSEFGHGSTFTVILPKVQPLETEINTNKYK